MIKNKENMVVYTVYDSETDTIPVSTITMMYLPELDDISPRNLNIRLITFDIPDIEKPLGD